MKQSLYSIPRYNIQRQPLKPQCFKDVYLAPPLKITFSNILHSPIYDLSIVVFTVFFHSLTPWGSSSIFCFFNDS